MIALEIHNDDELDALKRVLLTDVGHQVYAVSEEQTAAENLLCRVNALHDDLVHERAAAQAAGPEPDFPSRSVAERESPWRQ